MVSGDVHVVLWGGGVVAVAQDAGDDGGLDAEQLKLCGGGVTAGIWDDFGRMPRSFFSLRNSS